MDDTERLFYTLSLLVGEIEKQGLETESFIEKELDIKAKKNFLSIQAGDVNASLASTNLLKSITNSKFNTSLQIGISKFIKWYKNYYKSN